MSVFEIDGLDLLTRAMDAAQLNQKAISNNIANVDTPHYQRERVSFESQFADAKSRARLPQMRTETGHRSSGIRNELPEPKLKRITGTAYRNDRNNVDIDQEMAALTKNTMQYQALTRMATYRLSRLRNSIQGGR